MGKLSTWLYVGGAVAIALGANTASALWARGEGSRPVWLLTVLILAPLVFLSFGVVTARLGVAVSSGAIDALLTLSTIAVGLLLFGEWHRVSALQYLGMALALCGIFLMLLFPRASP